MLDEDELEELLELDELEPVSSSPPQAVSRANTSTTGASLRILIIPLVRWLFLFADTSARSSDYLFYCRDYAQHLKTLCSGAM